MPCADVTLVPPELQTFSHPLCMVRTLPVISIPDPFIVQEHPWGALAKTTKKAPGALMAMPFISATGTTRILSNILFNYFSHQENFFGNQLTT